MKGVVIMACIYFGTADIERIYFIDENYSKGIAAKASKYINNFGSKEGNAWRFNDIEVSLIILTKEMSKNYLKEEAFKIAMKIIYNIDCNRAVHQV